MRPIVARVLAVTLAIAGIVGAVAVPKLVLGAADSVAPIFAAPAPGAAPVIRVAPLPEPARPRAIAHPRPAVTASAPTASLAASPVRPAPAAAPASPPRPAAAPPLAPRAVRAPTPAPAPAPKPTPKPSPSPTPAPAPTPEPAPEPEPVVRSLTALVARPATPQTEDKAPKPKKKQAAPKGGPNGGPKGGRPNPGTGAPPSETLSTPMLAGDETVLAAAAAAAADEDPGKENGKAKGHDREHGKK